MGWYRDLPVRLSHINWYDMSNWVPWSGIEPGTTRFDSNLTSVLPLSYEYWNKSSGQSSERDIPFPQAIIVQTHPRTCRASHGVESWLYVSWLKSADNSDIYIVRMQFRLLSSGNFLKLVYLLSKFSLFPKFDLMGPEKVFLLNYAKPDDISSPETIQFTRTGISCTKVAELLKKCHENTSASNVP